MIINQNHEGEAANNTPNNYQAFYNSLKQQPEDLEQQRQHYQNINYKVASVEPARFRLPPCCEFIIDIIQLGLFAGCFYIIYDYLTHEDRLFPFHFMSLFIFYILSICVKYCTSSAKQFLQNAKCREEIQMYHANVSKNPPKIQYHVQAYHWVTRRTKNGTSRRKVVTYKHDEELKYMSHQDQTENLAVLLKNATCVRLNSKFTWFKGSKLTENNWEMMVQALNMTAQKMDTHHEGWDSSTVQGFVTNQLAFSKNGIPCYLDFPVLLFFYVFGISLFYDTFFYSVTGQCNFNIQKTIYCDAFNGPQIEQFLQQQQNINFNQPNNNNQFNGMNQGNIGMQPSNQNQGFMHPQQNMGYPQQNMGYPQQNMGYPYNNNYNYGQIMPQQNQMGYPNNMMYNQNQFNMGQPNDNIMLPPQQFDGQNDYSNNQMIPVGNQVK